MKWILELKLAINKVIKNKSNIAPVMLMDEFFLIFWIKKFIQVIAFWGLMKIKYIFTSQERRCEIEKKFGAVNKIELTQ